MLTVVPFDRFTMGFALSVHIVLAVIGIIIPLIILLAEYIGTKYNDKYYLTLAKRLTLGLVIFFAVGTASGMLVAANLLFLWPKFMALVSQVAILPVYIEVFAFFMESIFLALYIYSVNEFHGKYGHMLLMLVVVIGAGASGALITILNSFMNTPVGFNIQNYLSTGVITNIAPLATFTAPAVAIEVPHVLATSYFVGAMIFLAYFSYRFLKAAKDKEKIYYQKALKLVFAIALVGVVFAIITGILSINSLSTLQPEKYAAIELNPNTTAHAPEVIFGYLAGNSVQGGLSIPDLQSVLDGGSPSAVVPGLNSYPQSMWPPLFIHGLFDFMVGTGFGLGAFLFVIFVLHLLKKPVLQNKIVLSLFILSGFLSVAVLEMGWLVDEFGRQPWIIYNVMTVDQAANPSSGIIPIAVLIVILYIVVIPFTLYVLKKIFDKRPLGGEL